MLELITKREGLNCVNHRNKRAVGRKYRYKRGKKVTQALYCQECYSKAARK